MKTLFRRMTLMSLLFVSVLSLKAATISTNLSTGLNLLLLGAGQVGQLSLYTTNGPGATVYLIDSPTNQISTTNNGTSVSVSRYNTNVVTTYTNFFGNIENWTNTTTVTLYTTNSVVTNNYPVLGTFLLVSNVPQTITYSSSQPFVRGVLITNTAPVTILFQYLQ